MSLSENVAAAVSDGLPDCPTTTIQHCKKGTISKWAFEDLSHYCPPYE